MKQNLLFNQLTAMPKRLAMVLTVLFTLGVGSVLGADVTFTAGTDKGTTTNTSADSMTKSGITISSTSAGLAYDQYRFYNGTITISGSPRKYGIHYCKGRPSLLYGPYSSGSC